MSSTEILQGIGAVIVLVLIGYLVYDYIKSQNEMKRLLVSAKTSQEDAKSELLASKTLLSNVKVRTDKMRNMLSTKPV